MKTIVIDKNTPLNGNAKSNNTAKNSTALTVIEKPKEKVEPKNEPKTESKVMSFAERKDRAERLYDLFERHGKLKEHANELLGIVRADESVSTSFKLNSSNGHTWQTTNQEFIKKTVKVMHEAILTKIEEVEIEIELIQIS